MNEIAKKLRKDVLELIYKTKHGHIGGTFSCIEILVSLYYGRDFKYNSFREGYDKLLIGKGHIAPAIYLLMYYSGYITLEQLNSYGKNGTNLGCQLDTSFEFVDFNTGSLGNVIGIASGISLSCLDTDRRIFFLIGDAECEEGATLEAIRFAGEHKLDNIIGIIDNNSQSVTEIKDSTDYLYNYLKTNNWNVQIVHGHIFKNILRNISYYRTNRTGKPTMLICNTVKGKGISFMERGLKWHNAIPNEEEYLKAMEELNGPS